MIAALMEGALAASRQEFVAGTTNWATFMATWLELEAPNQCEAAEPAIGDDMFIEFDNRALAKIFNDAVSACAPPRLKSKGLRAVALAAAKFERQAVFARHKLDHLVALNKMIQDAPELTGRELESAYDNGVSDAIARGTESLAHFLGLRFVIAAHEAKRGSLVNDMKTIQNLNDLREMLVAGTGKHVVVRHSDAVVELTDDEIAKAMGWADLGQLDMITYDGIATFVLIRDVRAAIAADRAKQPAAGVELTDEEIIAEYELEMQQSLRGHEKANVIRVCRKAIAAHEAKKNGGGG